MGSLHDTGFMQFDLAECLPPHNPFLKHLSEQRIGVDSDTTAKATKREARFSVLFITNNFVTEASPSLGPTKDGLLSFYNSELRNIPCPELKQFIAEKKLLDMPCAFSVLLCGSAGSQHSKIIGAVTFLPDDTKAILAAAAVMEGHYDSRYGKHHTNEAFCSKGIFRFLLRLYIKVHRTFNANPDKTLQDSLPSMYKLAGTILSGNNCNILGLGWLVAFPPLSKINLVSHNLYNKDHAMTSTKENKVTALWIPGNIHYWRTGK